MSFATFSEEFELFHADNVVLYLRARADTEQRRAVEFAPIAANGKHRGALLVRTVAEADGRDERFPLPC